MFTCFLNRVYSLCSKKLVKVPPYICIFISECFVENEELPHYQELPLRGSTLRHLVNECSSNLRSLQSILWYLDESALATLNNTVKDLLQSNSRKVSVDKSNGLPVETESDTVLIKRNKKINKNYGKLSLRLKKGCSGRVGMNADMMKEAAKLNIDAQTSIAVPLKTGTKQCAICSKTEPSEMVLESKKMKYLCKSCC
jgi:hypothetical protein